MAATSAQSGASSSVRSIFETLSYGPVPDADNVAKAWLDDHCRQFGHFINGSWYKPEAGSQSQTQNPSTGEVLASVLEASEDDVNKAVTAAKEAFTSWSSLTPHVRARYLYSVARHVQKHQQLVSVMETLDSGRVMRESRDIEVPLVVRSVYHYAGWADVRDAEFKGFKPYGVVAVLPSFTRPLVSLTQRLCAALATGNTVVVCPSPTTPLSALLLVDICREAGLPAGVVNVVTDGRERDGMRRLVAHAHVDKVAFAGTTQVGRMLRQLVAGTGKSMSLELSGKSAMIVFENSDLDSVVEGVVDNIWSNQCQVNTAGSRLLVHEPVAERLARKLRQRLETVKVGDSLDKLSDIGALTCDWMPNVIEQFVDEARQEGAQIYQAAAGQSNRGWFYPPTLVVGAQAASRIVTEDFLGPVVALIPFRTAKEAIALANNSAYAMAASVWTESVTLAFEVGSLLQAGTVWINCHNVSDAAAGVGGGRLSGSGRTGGKRGVLEYMQLSSATPVKPNTVNVNMQTFGSSVAPRPSAPIPGAGDEKPAGEKNLSPYYDDTPITPPSTPTPRGEQPDFPRNGKRPDGQYSRPVQNAKGQVMGHVAEASRKDVRNAVEAAQKAVASWSKRAGHNRAQILFYLAENLQLRREELSAQLEALTGQAEGQGLQEVDLAIGRLFYWGAYCDKYGGTVQEVPFSGSVSEVNEAVGVIGIACPEACPLLGFVSLFAAAISRGNAVIAVPSEKYPLPALDLYQIFDTSDLPGGVVNILTGNSDHLTRFLCEHEDVQAVWYFGSAEGSKFVEYASAENMKRTWVNYGQERDFTDPVQGQGEEFLFHSTQPKTLWVPMGEIFAN
ncbi:hypothetical protein BaRGS_00015709 [Batillaria attramentaria]|uniref:Aldehyde dehydrogenase domain-containing protein n=1 Tax=Batillaria attramentaria TaxID=370345 RepID=A0ABD0L0N2_9CAEN